MPRWALIFIAVLIGADQLLKQYMLSLVFEPPRVIEVTGFFNLVPVWNRGVSFGMLGDSETSRWILVGLAFVIVAILVVWLIRAGSTVVVFALCW